MNYLDRGYPALVLPPSLIGAHLAGQVDAHSVLTCTCSPARVSAPLRCRWLRPRLVAKLMAPRCHPVGIMYLFYYHSFLLLTVPEVLVNTHLHPHLCQIL